MVNFNLCEFHLNFLVKKHTGINLFMSSSQKPYKFGTNAIIHMRKLRLEWVRDLVKVTQILDLKPGSSWLQSLGPELGVDPWILRAGWEMRELGVVPKERGTAQSRVQAEGLQGHFSVPTPATLSVLNLPAPANSALCSDCAPQLLSGFLWTPWIREQPQTMA